MIAECFVLLFNIVIDDLLFLMNSIEICNYADNTTFPLIYCSKKEPITLDVGYTQIKQGGEEKLLWITIDKGLSFKAHV